MLDLANIAQILAVLGKNSRTVRPEEPNPPKPEPKETILSKAIVTGTVSVAKFKTGTEEFWNRPSTSKIIKLQESQALTSHFESFWSIVQI